MAKKSGETVKRGYTRVMFQIPTSLKAPFEGLREEVSSSHQVQAKTVATAAVMLFLGLPREAQILLLELAHKYDLYPERADPQEAWSELSSALQVVGARRILNTGGANAKSAAKAESPEEMVRILSLDCGVENGRRVTMFVNALEHAAICHAATKPATAPTNRMA